MFSKSCEYAIKATIFIASKSSERRRVGLKEIATTIDSPSPFTAKILQKLSKNKIINSVKGVSGGFEIAPEQLSSITLMQVVVAIDGNHVFSGCGLGLETCSEEHPCPIHYEMKDIKEKLATLLGATSLEELASGVVLGLSFLKY